MRESKEREKTIVFFGLSDFYLFFIVSRKFKKSKEGILEKGQIQVFCICPIVTTTHSTRIVDDCGVSARLSVGRRTRGK